MFFELLLRRGRLGARSLGRGVLALVVRQDGVLAGVVLISDTAGTPDAYEQYEFEREMLLVSRWT